MPPSDGPSVARTALAVVASSAVALLAPAAAEAGFSSELVPVSDPALGGNVGISDIAVAPDGEALVAWQEGDVADIDAKVRRIHPDGSMGPILTVSDGTQRAFAPSVSFAPDGRAIVAWTENISSGNPSSVRARWIAPDDTLGPQITVRNGGMASDSGELTTTAASNGTAIVAFHNFVSSPGPFRRVEARRVNADNSVGGLIFPTSGAGSLNVRLAADTSGGALFLWSEGGIVTQPVSSGDVPGALNPISPFPSAFQALATDGADHFQAAYRKGNGPSSIEYRPIAANGTPGPEQNIDPAGATLPGPPDVATNPSNRTLVTWPRPAGTDLHAINARFIGSDGTVEPGTITRNVTTTVPPAVNGGIGGGGDAAIAWSQETATEPASINGRILPAGGAPSDPVRLSSATGGASRPLVEIGAGDVGLSAWSERLTPDDPNSLTQIMVRQILPPPTCLDASARVVQGRPTEVVLGCTGLQLEAPSIVDGPAHGTLGAPSATPQSVVYTPKPGFDGTDTFTFAGVNRGGRGATHTATIRVGRDTVKPKIKRFKIAPKRVKASRAKGKRAAFKLRYSERATAKIKLERRTGCRGKGCRKFAKAGKLKARKPGLKAKVPLRLKLAPGSYRATAVARDLAGNRSKPKRLKFRVAG